MVSLEGLLASVMSPFVVVQAGRLCKFLLASTMVANKCLFVAMDSLVGVACGRSSEGFVTTTMAAHERLFASVYLSMADEISRAHKLFWTLNTNKRSLSSMKSHMNYEIARTSKFLATVSEIANNNRLVCVDSSKVSFQDCSIYKSLSTAFF